MPSSSPALRRRALLVAVPLVAAALAALAVTRRAWLEPALAALHGDAGRFALALSRGLEGDPRALVPASSGAAVSALGGRLRLEVTSAPTAHGATPAGHLHVVGILGEPRPGRLEACLALPDGRAQTIADAAEDYQRAALPVALALAGVDDPGAHPFAGTESWGVAGVRGFVGPLSTRAILPVATAEALARAPLFEGLAVPADGRPHLARAVLRGDARGWRRALELDGAPTGVHDAPATLPPPAGEAVVIRFAAFARPDRKADFAARAATLARLAAAEPAVFAAGTCPLARMPARLWRATSVTGLCAGGRLADCAEECDAGAGGACLGAGLDLRADPATAERAQALFLRACAQGSADGCTNAAAAMSGDRTAAAAITEGCALPTFRRTCAEAQDPWGCAMLGLARARGAGGPRDLAEARALLERACAAEPRGDACSLARRGLAQLDAAAK